MNTTDVVSARNATHSVAGGRNKRGRVRRSREQRQELIAAFHASGLSQAAFCSRQGLHPATLNQWLSSKVLAGGPATKRRKTRPHRYAKRCRPDGAFAQVEVALGGGVPTRTASSWIEIELRSGLRLRVQETARLADLVPFLREVGAC
ncbi:MAG: hypothetical protein V1929_06620 [bacterium]